MAIAFRTLRRRVALSVFSRFSSNDSTSGSSNDANSENKRRVPVYKRDDWKSKLNIFAPEEGKAVGADFVNFLRGPKSFKSFYKELKEGHAIHLQRYIPERHAILGYDLATAHFIVYRGGAVKFCDRSDWIKLDEKDTCDMPNKFVAKLYLEAVDASNTELRYEGLSNFIKLKKLKWLSLRNCKHIDDWCLDRISGELSTLEYLDISDCHGISYRGLAAFYRLENLRLLKVHNIATTREFEFSCLLLEDINPQLVIEGVKYIELENSDS